MNRNVLVKKIVRFCFECEVFDKSSNQSETETIVSKRLEDTWFVESLINTIITRARTHKKLDVDELKELLIELEKIRIELEYKDYVA